MCRGVHDFAKRRLAFEDLGKRPGIGDPAFSHDDYPIEIDQCAQAMNRSDDARVGKPFAQSLEHGRFRGPVESARRLIEQQHRTAFPREQPARQRKPLALPPGKVDPRSDSGMSHFCGSDAATASSALKRAARSICSSEYAAPNVRLSRNVASKISDSCGIRVEIDPRWRTPRSAR